MRSEKAFKDVFPTFSTEDEEIDGVFSDVRVRRITSNASRSRLDVYIVSPHPIHKKLIMKTERELSKLFPGAERVRFVLHETFELSSQYDPKNLMDEYEMSVRYELKVEEPILFGLYKSSEKHFTGDGEYEIILPDTVIAHNMAGDLQSYFDRLFRDRCGLSVKVKIDYRKEEASDIRKEAEYRIREKIASISGRADSAVAAASGSGTAGKSGGGTKKSGYYGRRQEKGSYTPRTKKSDDPDVIYRKDVLGQTMEIAEVDGDMSDIVIRGQIASFEEKPVKEGAWILMKFNLTDFTDTIGVRLFLHPEEAGKLKDELKPGAFIKLCGSVQGPSKYEKEMTIGSVKGIRRIPDFRVKREDHAPVKRVELHCHTKMSNLDAVCGVEDVMKRADRWGWNAIAITDHGSVQAFPEALHAMPKMENKDLKLIYGMEGYLVDDTKKVVGRAGEPDPDLRYDLDDTFCVFDIETTGFSPVRNRIIEIGAVLVQGGKVVDRFDEFVNPEVPIPYKITKLTHITDRMVMEADTIDKVLPRFLEFSRGAAMVGHNVSFDISFIAHNAKKLRIPFDRVHADTMVLSRLLLPKLGKHTLDRVAKELGVSLETHHRAVDDSEATAGIWVKLCELLKEKGIRTLDGIGPIEEYTDEMIGRLRPFHVILLAKNETGRVNLYRLVSESHSKYFVKVPRIPKSFLMKHREGLIIGSACEAGELYRAVMEDRPEDEIAGIVDFYDYLEIQPIGNNAFLLEEDNNIETEEDLREVNRRITELGEQFHKPVCATCDVHFLEPEDDIYRKIIRSGKNFKDNDEQPPLYLRTTDEMLEEFSYLGSDKAREVVIENTNLIADMIDRISPVRPDKCPPVIDNSDGMLREICYKRAREIYGEELPAQVEERLEKELNSIIGNGYAVMYIIAQKLVWKSNEDGYLVGSRGSVGSSFAAYTAGITEVNSLPPHYLCPSCHYSEFDSEEVKKFAAYGICGVDMPDKNCPVCGKPLSKLGFDIPFETFLGFKGDKEPDIDLNFSGDYQSKAHKYVEVIFGAGSAFRAGTMGTVAEKTAYGYVKHYYDQMEEFKRSCEMERLAMGCTGVLRTTGQHPGGIVVLPRGEEIDTFTPVQHPADDMQNDIITTHYEYHSIDHNLLKLDILGHDDPTMIKFLQDMTGVDPEDIPFDDEKVLSLFLDTSALGITPEDIGGTPNGALGIPEFGTRFVINMLIDAKPKNLSDLIRISGLSHGTDVWVGNADELIRDGKTLSDCICCRDDIMIYLIGKGMDPQLSFKTMESVRKGKGLSPEMEDAMKAAGVPEWYIGSCKKIKYMFPKAHAAAYVMMALRVAWHKVYRPIAYYCAFFSIRAKGFSYSNCCRGREHLLETIEAYEKKEKELKAENKKLSDVEANELHDMHLVQEMYARGIEFMPIDMLKVNARYFREIDGKIMPALASVDNIGAKAADAMVTKLAETADAGPFLSVEDFCARSGASRGVADKLSELGILSGIPESNQLSLFDL